MARPRSFDADEALVGAVEVFWRRGFAAASIDDLERATGISRSSIYAAWGSKDGLYRAALESYQQANAATFVAALRDPGADAREVVAARLHQVVDAALEQPYGPGCFVVNAVAERASADEHTRDRTGAGYASLEDEVAAALGRAAATHGWTPPLPARELARLVVVVIQGLRVVGRVRPERAVLEGAVGSVLALLGADHLSGAGAGEDGALSPA